MVLLFTLADGRVNNLEDGRKPADVAAVPSCWLGSKEEPDVLGWVTKEGEVEVFD